MGAGHGHLGHGAQDVRIGRWPRIAVIALVVVSGLAALLGVLHWWPDRERVDHLQGLIPVLDTGISLAHGELLEVQSACTGNPVVEGRTCGDSRVRILDGAAAGRTVPLSLSPDVVGTGLTRGDHVLLFDSSGVTGTPSSDFTFYRADRGGSLLWLAILFAIGVVLVAWRRGFMALVSLAFAGVVVIGFLIPALLIGRPPVPVVLAASVLILVVMLYATHGFSMRTSVALVGALVGVGLSAAFAWFGVVGARLGGLGDEAAGLLTFNVQGVSVQQLVVASVILAGLGTLNDVTVTQASAIWELRAASPTMPRSELFRRSLSIGRDHVASTVYTLVFAYLGTALVLLVAVQLYRGTAYDFATAEDVAEEIVRALVGGLALVLAMPITTAIGALIVPGAETSSARRRGSRRRTPGPIRRGAGSADARA